MEIAPRGVRMTAVCPGIIKTNIIHASRFSESATSQRDVVERLYARVGTAPSRVAADVVRAVKRKRGVQITPFHVWPLWMLKRASVPAYQTTFGLLRRLL